MGVRSPATRAFCCCASSMRNWRSRKNLPGFSTIGVIRCSSSTTPMRCCVKEFIRSAQATRTATTLIHCAAIPRFKPSLVNPILWPLNPRSRVWRITPTSKPSKGWAPWVFSGFCTMPTASEKLPRKSYWTPMPPTIPATASKSLPSFMENTASTCITRCFSSKLKPALCSPPCFAPAMPRPQRESPLNFVGYCLSLNVVSLKVRSAIGPMPARLLQRSTEPYAIGIASNSVFKKRTECWLNKATRKYARTQVPIRLFYSFRHRARSWNKRRRIVVKIEVGPLGTNVRFVITNRPGRAEQIYDGYDDRGECENRIKEFKRDLSADRLSCHSYRANAFRLKLHALAYQLLVLFRLHALRTTDLAHARLETLRLKLFKVGARFKSTARHFWFHLSSSWPGRDLFVEIWQKLKRLPQPAPS